MFRNKAGLLLLAAWLLPAFMRRDALDSALAGILDEFGADLPVRLMFDNPTVEALAIATVEAMLETRGDDQIARLLADLEQTPEEVS